MSDVSTVLRAVPRVLRACRARSVTDPDSGREVSAHRAEILRHLDARDPVMVGELAEHLGVTPSTMSLTLKRLERAGYVRRDRDPADRRVTNVRLTEEGERLRDARELLDPGRVDRLLLLLAPSDRRRAVEGLSLLARAADSLLGGHGGAPGAAVPDRDEQEESR